MDMSHLKCAEELYSQGDYAGAFGEIASAINDIAKESKEFILSVVPNEIEAFILSAIRRMGEAAGAIPDLAQYAKIILPELADAIPSSLADLRLEDLKTFLVGLFKMAEKEANDTPSDFTPEENPEDVETFKNLIKRLDEEIQLRNMIFSSDGAYQTFCMAATPFVSGALLHLKDGDPETASRKAEDILQGPGRNLAILGYSFLTSEFLAGLVLLFLRRRIPIPFVRRSGIAAKVDFMRFMVPNTPLIIAGLSLVYEELKSIKEILATSQKTITAEIQELPEGGIEIPIQ